MNNYPSYGPPPPGYSGPWPPPPPYYPQQAGLYPPPYPPHDGGQLTPQPPYPTYDGGKLTHPQPYPPHDGGQLTAHVQPPYPYYIPGTVMVPVPMQPMPQMPAEAPSNPTYITNYIYHGEASNTSNPAIEGQPVETSGDFDWVPTTSTTASHLTGKAVIGGHEGWDGSPLWVIRAWHQGDLIPGKFSIRHTSASIMNNGKEIPVQNIEVLVARPESLRWIPASNGNVPPGAIPGGKTSSGETLYVGRARHQLSLTPGKVHPSHNTCYIGFSGSEVSLRSYDVLCRIS